LVSSPRSDTICPMKKLDSSVVAQIRELRRTGHSLPEITSMVEVGYGTVWRYIKDVQVGSEYEAALKVKQGGSRSRSEVRWREARNSVKPLIGDISKRDKLLILAALYWGEGTKKELNIINSDPQLLAVFVDCLESLGVSRESLTYSLRTHSDVSISQSKKYWAQELGVGTNMVKSVEVVQGKKRGKLPHGMCRIRMRKGERYFKQIMSMIELISTSVICPRSSMDRTAAS
jgi:hypothetical protein